MTEKLFPFIRSIPLSDQDSHCVNAASSGTNRFFFLLSSSCKNQLNAKQKVFAGGHKRTNDAMKIKLQMSALT